MKKNRLLENYYKLPKGQRIQLKKYLCILAVAFLLFLLFLNLLHSCGREGTDTPEMLETSPQHIPVVQNLKNVWITDAEADRITIFCDGEKETFFLEAETEGSDSVPAPEQMREQLADVELTDELVSAVVLKTDKFTGRVLSANENGIEIEGRGRIPLAEDYKGYRLYRELTMCTFADLTFGYANADFIQENGEICGILLAREANMEDIRVLIKTSDYVDILHTEVILTANSDFLLQYGSGENIQEELFPKGDKITIDMDSDYFVGERISIVPAVLTGRIQLLSVNRSQGIPSYRGHIELLRTAAGIAVVNELPLEEYLFSVVPSEMPASYPLEALKAQAICARTYAYRQIQANAYSQYGAHVDDSTNYQVYNNIDSNERTNLAIKETDGEMVFYGDTPAETYYFSTSCGYTTDGTIWGADLKDVPYLQGIALTEDKKMEDMTKNEVFVPFIQGQGMKNYDSGYSMYRWSTTITNKKLAEKIDDIGTIQALFVTERGTGGIAKTVKVIGSEGEKVLKGQTQIRNMLGASDLVYKKNDGSTMTDWASLPSAFIAVDETARDEEKGTRTFTIWGGGYGHGVGMSQNGAQQMAKEGKTYKEILNFFYSDVDVRELTE